jgi:hypothetical protein
VTLESEPLRAEILTEFFDQINGPMLTASATNGHGDVVAMVFF